MSTSTFKPTSVAIAQNKEALLEAEDRRLVSSWLKPSLKPSQALSISTSTTTTTTHNTIDEEDDNEEDFAAEDETAGMGYTVPKDSSGNSLDRTNLSANDKLRKQMLGKNASRSNHKTHSHNGTTQSASKPMPRKAQRGDSDDETEGRTRAADKKTSSSTNSDMSSSKVSSAKKRPASYLDEMLAKRSAKQSKTTRQDQLSPKTKTKTKKTDEVDD